MRVYILARLALFVPALGLALDASIDQFKITLPSLLDATADELAAGLQAKRFTSVDLVKAYTRRISEVNNALHAVTEVNPDALKIAKELDEERKCGKLRGPLHGLPMVIKNNITTADLMNNTAGSYALLGTRVPRDATVAAKLRKAGVILLGKSNLSQWANFRSANSSNGWSAHGGQVYGAYYPKQDPSGSSSGSGVSSSLGLALAALGTGTDGSILSPAQVNNIVGIKPTVGLTSRALFIPISAHQDTVGPMARTVKDAAYVLQAIAGKDEYDNYTSAIPGNIPNYVAACKLDALKGKRVGVPRNTFETNTEPGASINRAFNAALKVLKDAGATIVENTNYTAWEQLLQSQAESLYLKQLTYNPNNVTNLADVTKFTKTFTAEEYPSRDTFIFDSALALPFDNTSPQAWAAYQYNHYLGGIGGLFGALKNYTLDAVVLPANVASPVSAVIGGPVVTVPLGALAPNSPVVPNSRGDLVASCPNYPFGIAFAGPLWSEANLIGFAYAFEHRTKVRKQVKPCIVPKTELVDVIGK